MIVNNNFWYEYVPWIWKFSQMRSWYVSSCLHIGHLSWSVIALSMQRWQKTCPNLVAVWLTNDLQHIEQIKENGCEGGGATYSNSTDFDSRGTKWTPATCIKCAHLQTRTINYLTSPSRKSTPAYFNRTKI